MTQRKYYLANTYISGILLKCVSFLSWKFWRCCTNIRMMKEILLEEIHVFFLLEYVSLSFFPISVLHLLYNISSISYVFCNKHFTAFLERQIYKDKPTYLFALKFEAFILIWCDDLLPFSHLVIFFLCRTCSLHKYLQVISLSHL